MVLAPGFSTGEFWECLEDKGDASTRILTTGMTSYIFDLIIPSFFTRPSWLWGSSTKRYPNLKSIMSPPLGGLGTFPLLVYMDVSENSGAPKASILIGYSIINHPFWGPTTHISLQRCINVSVPGFPDPAESAWQRPTHLGAWSKTRWAWCGRLWLHGGRTKLCLGLVAEAVHNQTDLCLILHVCIYSYIYIHTM